MASIFGIINISVLIKKLNKQFVGEVTSKVILSFVWTHVVALHWCSHSSPTANGAASPNAKPFCMWRRSFGVAAAILLIATLQTDAEGLEDVLEWFQAAGGRARKVRVVERDNTRFVVAASQIKAGEVVISTPQSMVLTRTECVATLK